MAQSEACPLVKRSVPPPVRSGKKERLQSVLVVAAAAGLLLYLIASTPEAPLIRTPPCPFRTLTGFYSPGCGTRSALLQLARGNFYAAWRLNQLTITLLPAGILFFASHLLAALTGRPRRRVFLPPWLIWVIFIAFTAFWILRNIPVYPFILLRPTIV
jgi:hypothetical protein